MIYLLDTPGLVRLFGDVGLQEAWYDAVEAETIASCYPQRPPFPGCGTVAVSLNRGRTTVTAQTGMYDSERRLVAQTTQIQAVRTA